jgi:hypothetical protein
VRLRGEIEQLFGRERNAAHATCETLLEPKDSAAGIDWKVPSYEDTALRQWWLQMTEYGVRC